MDKEKIDFDAPAFGVKASVSSTEGSQPEKEVEVTEKEPVSSPTEGDVEEQEVPYSRFQKVHRKALEAQQEADEWKRRYEESQRPERQEAAPAAITSYTGQLPQYWVNLWGDDERSRAIYANEMERLESVKAEARREAVNAIREERIQEERKVYKNVSVIDAGIDDLSAVVGRDLSESEQSAVLDIVDDYTPKDEYGNYMGPLIPFEKAWQVYELQQARTDDTRKKSRNAVTAVTGSRTEGEPTAQTEKNNSFNPLDWNAYRKRI